ncbi:MAG: sensor histidine kinase [Anaerovoracaceae bacterium]|jgi:two-component system sensor histidine kinase KdpD
MPISIRLSSKWEKALNILLAVLIFLAATGIGFIFRTLGYSTTNIAVVYLLAVLLIVWICKRFVAGFVASIAASFAYNYFFSKPYDTFSVDDPNYYMTILTLLLTALATSVLTARAQKEKRAAQRKETETKALYALTNQLTDARSIRDIAGISAREISSCFGCDAACLCMDEDGEPEHTFVYYQYETGNLITRREYEDPREMKYRISNMRTGPGETEEFYDWPISGGEESTLGLIRLAKVNFTRFDDSGERLFHAMVESVSLAMDRMHAAQERIRSREEAMKERYRVNLLRAISHDIRTPLTNIIGTSEMLTSMLQDNDEAREQAQKIEKDAEWLHSLVENILSMTRLKDGKFTLKKEMVPLEEVVGGAIARVSEQAPEYDIEVEVPDELIMAPMDAKLIEQVVINLLQNAVHHSEPFEPIQISISSDPETEEAVCTVRDGGEGISKKDLPHIFKPFYTSRHEHREGERSIGLGLAICETIISAHGGTITAGNRQDGGQGAEFTFRLPMKEKTEEEEEDE